MTMVDLVIELATCHHYLAAIHHYDCVARQMVRRELRLVPAAQQDGDLARHAPQNLSASIYVEPVAVNGVIFIGKPSFHRCLLVPKLTERWLQPVHKLALLDTSNGNTQSLQMLAVDM